MRGHHPDGEAMERRGGERSGDPGTPRAVALAAAFLLPLYLGLALAYRDAVPLFEAPDEPAHLHYAVFVYQHARLPHEEPLEVPGEGGQPPLVYALAAPLLANAELGLDAQRALWELGALGREIYGGDGSAPEADEAASIGPSGAERGGPGVIIAPSGRRIFAGDGSLAGLRVLRSVPLAFGLLAVTFTFAAVWRVGRDARLALLATALLAFNPQFLFASATFSNDTAAAAVGAAVLWVVLRALEEGGPSRSHYIWGAVLIALGVHTKLSTLPGLAAGALALVAMDDRHQRDRRVDLALAAGLVLLLAGPYLVWTLEQRSGPLALDAVVSEVGALPRPEEVGDPFAYLTGPYWERTFQSYWGRFGWLDLRAPAWVYLTFFALTWTGLLGYYTGRILEPNALLRSRALRAYLVGAVGLTLLAHLALNWVVVAAQGRHLFAAAPQISLLLALGLNRLLGHEHRTMPLTVSVVGALLALALYCLRGVIVPAYVVP